MTNDIRWRGFKQQAQFLRDQSRIRCLLAAKRSGKSEPAYIDTILKCENQPGYVDDGIDPYLCAIIAPTDPMLKRLVWPKFRKFAAPFEADFNKVDNVFTWDNPKRDSIIYGVSAQKISRLEGLKLYHIHITEAFQMSDEVLFEALARVSDTRGTITIDGSLGPTIPNPKAHWIYQTFVKNPFPDSRVWIWFTRDNPHFPKDELDRMRNALDPVTYRQMFEMDFDTVPSHAVYSELDPGNFTTGYAYNPELPTYVSIDWGWAHPMACLFFQYNKRTDTVYLFDEIVQSKLTLPDLWAKIKAKPYRITGWCCDVAGDQEREQTGRSNIRWFRDKHGIHFKTSRAKVQPTIPIVRAYIKNGLGQSKFIIDERNCPKSADSMKQYHYAIKDGVIQNENPVKENDDPADAIRYFFVNFMRERPQMQIIMR